jgi:hypothetical protein
VKFAERYPDLDLQLVATARLFSLSKREADIAISLSMRRKAGSVRLPITSTRPWNTSARCSAGGDSWIVGWAKLSVPTIQDEWRG